MSSSSHYIRTIHTSFTAAAHPSPWAARSSSAAAASPLLTSNHANMPLYTAQPLGAPAVATAAGHNNTNNAKYGSAAPAPASGAGGRRRAYAFRVPSVAAPTPRKGGYKFDPFADEPVAPATPNLSQLASLSVPPAPRLAAATLPPPAHARRQQPTAGGMYNHQLHTQQQRRHQHQQQANMGYRRQPVAFDTASGATTEIWRGFSPLPKARALTYEVEEYDDFPSTQNVFRASSGGNGGLLTSPFTPTPRRSASAPPPPPISGPAAAVRRSALPSSPTPSKLNPQSPVFTPSRPLARTPSPPAPAPGPTYANTRSSMLNDKDAKARLVAGILLNRVHQQRPMRRRPMFGDAKRAYVPSGLSRVVACEA